jgi:hypothetical protein
MAITKIHPIKSTLENAINYITKKDKTDEKIFVSSLGCVPETAHLQFQNTREINKTRGNVLAHHLIQSFYPGEVTPEKAHEIGEELANKILGSDYEYIVATHVDKNHIHNHIIFNNVNSRTGKCYRSNTKSYYKIRNESDRLCKENNLIVIDEYYKSYKRKFKTRGTSWYEHEQSKKGKSWKSRLQFDIDRAVRKAKDWEDFLKIMESFGYEIKQGKHISFRNKEKQKRFTRSFRIGEDYTEDRLKERIEEEIKTRSSRPKAPFKRVDSVIDISSNNKIKGSPAYKNWAVKHNLKTMADTVLEVRKEGFKTRDELENALKENANKVQELLTENKNLENKIESKMQDMENRHTIDMYKHIYDHVKMHPKDTDFQKAYATEIKLYKTAVSEVFKTYETLPTGNQLLEEIEQLEADRIAIKKQLEHSRKEQNKLYQYKKNYDTYLGKEIERY